MKSETESGSSPQRCPVGVVYVEGRIICYDHARGGELTARELGTDGPVRISPAMQQAILADIEHQRVKCQAA
jgi:hypothetical protein